MNGELKLRSTWGQGSTFTLFLRDVETCTATALSHDKPDWRNYQFEKASLLIADDMPMNCDLLRTYLEAYPFDMTFVSNGQEALDAAQKHQPDLILMDYKMPVMDGLEATQNIRRFSQVPIIIVSASTMRSDEKRIKAEASSFLSKPIECSALIQKLAKYLPFTLVEPPDGTNLETTDSKPVPFDLPLLLEACQAQVNPLMEQWHLYPGSYDIMTDLNEVLNSLIKTYPHPVLLNWQAEYQQAFNCLNMAKVNIILEAWPDVLASIEQV